MITKQAHNGNVRVEEYGFAEWLAQVEPLLRDGYKFDFVTNENYPVGYGQMYTATLVPILSGIVPSVSLDAATEAPWAIPGDVDKALNILQKESSAEDKPTDATPTSKVDGRKKK